MRLVLDTDSRMNLVRRYGEGTVVIGEHTLTRPLIVTPTQLLTDWPVISLEALEVAQLEPLFGLSAQVVLLGSGERQSYPSAVVRAAFRQRGIALECMTLGAACRTYNILAGERRSVVAGLFPGTAGGG
jgi:uncharacterized protein